MLHIRETWTDETRDCHLGRSEWYEPYTTSRGALFRALQRDYGRCMSTVYQDAPRTNLAAGFGAVDSAPCGWYFERRRRYEDSRDTYLAGTWVELRTV